MDPRNLRVSDAEREHVGGLLQKAVGQGMLSLGEFTERMDTALAAKTRGELNAVLADLPGMQVAEQHEAERRAPAVHTPHPAPVSPYESTSSTLVRGRMTTLTRKGPWQVPRAVTVDTRMSSVTLDFTQAVMSSQVVDVHIDDYMSTISLVVPDEATVDLNGIEVTGGSATNKVRTGPPIGRLHLVVRGKVRFGSITAKHPMGTTFRRMFGG